MKDSEEAEEEEKRSYLFPYTEEKPLPDIGVCCEYGGLLPDDPEFDEEGNIVGIIGLCPNASNPYHECSEYCQKRWGSMLYDDSESHREIRASSSKTPDISESSQLVDEIDNIGRAKESEIMEV